MASSRPALTGIPQRNQPHWDRPVNSGPRPCLFSVGFPLSGSRDRTSTSDLNIRTWHTRYGPPSGRASATTAASPTPRRLEREPAHPVTYNPYSHENYNCREDRLAALRAVVGWDTSSKSAPG